MCYKNHLLWQTAEKDALASYSNSFLPLSALAMIYIPVFDYILSYTVLKLITVYVLSL